MGKVIPFRSIDHFVAVSKMVPCPLVASVPMPVLKVFPVVERTEYDMLPSDCEPS